MPTRSRGGNGGNQVYFQIPPLSPGPFLILSGGGGGGGSAGGPPSNLESQQVDHMETISLSIPTDCTPCWK